MIKDSKSSKFFKFTTSKIILLGFSTLILIGAFLLCLPISNTAGTWSSFIDALFTSTSSVCVTGLIVYDVAIELSLFGQIIVLFLIQIGGLGFVSVTSFLFLLIGKKIDYATRLTIQESFNKEDSQDVIKTVIIVTLTTFICEFIGFLMILPSMIQYTGSFSSGLFKSLFLAVAAFCNAGIDPMGSTTPSFSNLSCFSGNAWILIPVMILIFIGGIGFIVITDLINRVKNRKKLVFIPKLYCYCLYF